MTYQDILFLSVDVDEAKVWFMILEPMILIKVIASEMVIYKSDNSQVKQVLGNPL